MAMLPSHPPSKPLAQMEAAPALSHASALDSETAAANIGSVVQLQTTVELDAKLSQEHADLQAEAPY